VTGDWRTQRAFSVDTLPFVVFGKRTAFDRTSPPPSARPGVKKNAGTLEIVREKVYEDFTKTLMTIRENVEWYSY
jgi:hypothetical protein